MSSGRLRRLTRTVGFRLTLLHSGLFTLLGLSILGLAYAMLHDAILTADRQQVETRALYFADRYAEGGLYAVKDVASLRKGRLQKAFFLRIADRDNRTLYLRDPEDWEEFTPDKLVHPLETPTGQRAWLRLDHRDEYSLEVASMQFPDGNVLQVGKTTEDMRDVLKRFRYLAGLTIALIVPAGFAGGAFFSLRALRPVRQLRETVEGVLETGKFDKRVPSRGVADELDELVALFNSLLGRIESLIRAMRESLDNVAHDLRTPMTRLRNGAQSCLEHDVSTEQAKEALADCVDESERVLTILNTLMDISEAETRILPLKRESIHLPTIMSGVMDLYEEVAEERGVSVDVEIPSELRTCGDPIMLRRAFANLLDNAIKYSGEGGAVTVSARQEIDAILLTVQDTGAGISKSDLPRIWDRLYRGDKSRSARGLGLGLSFVRAIVESHGGTVDATSELGKGSRFSVRLPTVPAGTDFHGVATAARTKFGSAEGAIAEVP